MKKVLVLLLAAVLTVGLVGTVALAQPPEHPHMLILHPEVGLVDGVPSLVGFHRCVDLANNRGLPLRAHHDGIHTGSAGGALAGAGHAAAPAAPLTPWADCAAFESALPIPLP